LLQLSLLALLDLWSLPLELADLDHEQHGIPALQARLTWRNAVRLEAGRLLLLVVHARPDDAGKIQPTIRTYSRSAGRRRGAAPVHGFENVSI
jgi:hypothetical protein